MFARYDSYLASITDKLPKKLLEFHHEHTLHDAEVKKIISSFPKKSIQMELRGWDVQLQNPTYYTLKFSGVTEFEQVLPQQEYVESELGDLGYWEIEALSPGIEIRMLFVSEQNSKLYLRSLAMIIKKLQPNPSFKQNWLPPAP